jgi:DNA ligase-1
MPKQILPETLAPMLATSGTDPFDSADFLFEVKWDGIRCVAFLEASSRLQSRNLNDITYRYPDLLDLHQGVKGQPAVLDGEIIVLRDGKPSFEDLQKRDRSTTPARIRAAVRERPAVFVAFDLLYFKGQKITGFPLARRRNLLEQVLVESESLVLSQSIPEHGIEYCRAVFAQGLEGVMAKRLDSAYLPGKRTKNWLKIKRTMVIDAVIAGVAASPRDPRRPGSLVLGLFTAQGELKFVGQTGTGFSEGTLSALLEEVRNELSNEPVIKGVPPSVAAQTVWFWPRHTCRVEFLEFTSAGRLRHATYRGPSSVPPGQCSFSQLQ